MTLGKKPSESIVEKGENAGYQHFPFSHNDCYPSQNKFQFSDRFNSLSAKAFNLDLYKKLYGTVLIVSVFCFRIPLVMIQKSQKVTIPEKAL